MTTENDPREGSPLSDVSSERAQDSPTLFTVGQPSAADTHTTTNESVTSVEDYDLATEEENDSDPTEDVRYAREDQNIVLSSQVSNERVFRQIVEKPDRAISGTKERSSSCSSGFLEPASTKSKRRRQQVCVRYKRQTGNAPSVQSPLSGTLTAPGRTVPCEDRKSLTCHNPIAIIQDLDAEVTTGRKGEINELRMENEELRQRLKEQSVLSESRSTELDCVREDLAKLATKAQLLEEENFQLAQQADKFLSVTTKSAEVNTSYSLQTQWQREEGSQTEREGAKSAQTQTDTSAYTKAVENLKAELAAQSELVTRYEKDRSVQKLELAQLQQALSENETEKIEWGKKRASLSAEVQSLRLEHEKQKKLAVSLTNEVKELRLKETNAESENKILSEENGRLKEEIAIIDDQPEALKEMTEKLAGYEQVALKLEQELKAQKKLSDDALLKLDDSSKRLEVYKQEVKKQAEKIKEVKKERDMLKIDNLKQKQMFSEKCEGYREIRGTLRRKLKQKDDLIIKLQQELNSRHVSGIAGRKDASPLDGYVETEVEPRPRSLENTGKRPLKDLASTLKLEEYSAEIKKKLEDAISTNARIAHSERTPDEGKSTPNSRSNAGAADRVNNDNVTDKSKSFYSDDTNAFLDAKNGLDQAESHGVSNASNSRESNGRLEAIEERLRDLRDQKADIESKLTSGFLQPTRIKTPVKEMEMWKRKAAQEGKNKEGSSIHSDSEQHLSDHSQSQQQQEHPQANFIVNPHHVQARLKNSSESRKGSRPDGEPLKFKYKLTPKLRDLTPPVLRSGSENKGPKYSKAEKLVSPHRTKALPTSQPEEPAVLEPVNFASKANIAAMIAGHYTPGQSHVSGGHKAGAGYFEVRSASATRKAKEAGTAAAAGEGKRKEKGAAKNVNPHPRTYISKHPMTAMGKELPMKAFINKGIKR